MFDINRCIDVYTPDQDARDCIRDAINKPVSTLTPDERDSIIVLMYSMLRTELTGYYLYSIISDKYNYHNRWADEVWVDNTGASWPALGKLFHANSVKTAIDFISRKELYSREYGVGLGIQTPQRTDADDQAMGIFNDIFFDNSDIPYYAHTNTSAYGPVMFVFNPEVINDNGNVLLTKTNPILSRTMSFKDLYYFNGDEIKEHMTNTRAFLLNGRHHTTLSGVPELPFGDLLFAIYIEKHRTIPGRENDLAALLRQKLDAVGLNHVPVVIRPNGPTNSFGMHQYATNYDALWEFP